MTSAARVLATLGLFVAGALGLLMSLCGGAFTIAGLATSEMVGVLAISVPSLALGAGLLWFAVRKFRGRSGRPAGH